MAKSLTESLKDPKVRNLIIFGVILFIAFAVILYFILHKPNPLQNVESKTTAPPQVTAIPGGVTSERYQQLQEEENRKRTEAAKEKGTSAVATIIGAQGKDSLTGRESFGIEGEYGVCKCAECSAATAQKLLARAQAYPKQADELLKANPSCLGRALCTQKPDLTITMMEKNEETAKTILKNCPEIAQRFAEKDPALFKKLMLENPELAKKLAESNPALFKKLMLEDPAFAKAMAEKNPELLKKLMTDDPKFADQFGAKYPDVVKKLMMDDPEFARTLARNNPALVKKMMLDDPAFAKWMAKNMPETVKSMMANDPDFAKALLDKNPDMKALVGPPPLNAREEAEEKARLAREAQLAAQKEAQLADLQQKQIDAIMNSMDSQTKAMFQAWNEFSTQQFVTGEWRSKHEHDEEGGGEGGVGPGGEVIAGGRAGAGPAALIKAGTVAYAVLDTAVNSDEPGPILATIIEGPLKGSRLIGTMSPTTPPVGGFPEKVMLNFSTLSAPNKPTSIGIQAVAIDPCTARTALASDVDHHYLIRYGTLFASAFLVGYAKVITSMGTTQTTAANGLATTTTTPILSNRQQIFAALGQVGQTWAQAVAPYANLPPTITVDQGEGLGILFLQDVPG